MHSPDRGYRISVIDILSVHLAGFAVVALVARTAVMVIAGA